MRRRRDAASNGHETERPGETHGGVPVPVSGGEHRGVVRANRDAAGRIGHPDVSG